MIFYVSFECFHVFGKREIAELCILDEEGHIRCHGTLETKHNFSLLPDHERRIYRFLIFNYHYILWNEGFITSSALELFNQHIPFNSQVMCKGLENKRLIQSIRPDLTVLDLDTNVKKIDKIYKTCYMHFSETFNCALNKNLHLFNSVNNKDL